MMDFAPLTLSEFQTLHPFFKQQPFELCSYSLASIIAWNNESYTPYYAVSEDDLFLCPRIKGRQKLLLPLPSMDRFPPQVLQDLALKAAVETFTFVPRQYLQYFGQEQAAGYFQIEEQTDYADYVYLVEDLATLKGNKYSKKRNLVNQFDRRYVQRGRVEVADITPAGTAACIDFLEEWCASNDCDAQDMEDLACEKQAAIFTLNHLEQLGSRGLLLRIDGKICAFGIAASLTRDMGVLHFEKAFSDIKGLYQYFDRECARRLFKGLRYINKEEDLGEPGLRKAKKSYHPVKMIKSYQLTVR